MNIRPILLAAVLILAPFHQADSADYVSKKTVLDNGMTVIVSEMPSSPMVSIYGLVKTGAATEGEFLGSGLSHFLEHMLFKGTEKRKVGEIAAAIQAVGGTINASTGYDHTIYTITVPVEQFDTGLDILADALMNSTLDETEFRKERDVVFSEMRLHKDNPDRYLGQLVFAQAYTQHPYQHPVIGYEKLFGAISRDDLMKFYRMHYSPNNMVLSVAGGISIDQTLPKIEKTFGSIEPKNYTLRNLTQEPEQITPRYYEEEYPTPLARMAIVYPSVNLLHRDLYALDVLATILGQGESSRLFQDLVVSDRIAYEISAYNYTPMDRGIFGVTATFEIEKLEQVREGIVAHITAVQDKGVSPQELEKAKRQALVDYVREQQTSDSVAYSQATDEAFTGDPKFSQNYAAELQKVSVSDIKRVAQQYLKSNAATTVVLKPKTEKQPTLDSKQEEAKPQIEKFIFENGLTVLLREDRSLPLVSLRLMAQGGLRQEPEELNGISNLTALLWPKGTKKYSSQAIAQLTDSRGINLGAYSGKNSLGLSMNFLSDDLNQALDIVQDFIKNPAFPEDELSLLKEQVKAAIRSRDDNIYQFTFYHLFQTLFAGHPYGLDEKGTVESLDRIGRSEIQDFYAATVVPQNLVLAIFGDIDKEVTLKALQKKLGKISSGEYLEKKYPEFNVESSQEKVLDLDKAQTMVAYGFQGVPLDDPDRFGLEILTEILSSPFSGRLFTKVREELGKAYNLGGNSVPGIETGTIYFYILTTQENAGKVKELFAREVKDLQNTFVSDQELADMKAYLKGTFEAGIQTNDALSFTSGLDELYNLGFENYKEYAQKIDAVTKEDVKRIAGSYLNLSRAVILVTQPPAEEK